MATSDYIPTSISIQLGYLMNRRNNDIPRILMPFRTYVVYVIRDKWQVLYVGSSNQSAKDRIRNHIYDKHSMIGASIKDNKPNSLNWFVEIYKHNDHKEIIQAEKELIKQLKPLFNRTHNQ